MIIVVAFAGRPLANGQYILVSRAAYDALGGHAALRAEIVEDIEFAKRLHADGRFRLPCAWRSAHASRARVRMYRSFRQLWNGFTKNVFIGNEGNAARAALSVVSLALLSVVPPALAIAAFARGRKLVGLEALCCTAATVSASAWMFSRLGFPRRYSSFVPLGFAVVGRDYSSTRPRASLPATAWSGAGGITPADISRSARKGEDHPSPGTKKARR